MMTMMKNFSMVSGWRLQIDCAIAGLELDVFHSFIIVDKLI